MNSLNVPIQSVNQVNSLNSGFRANAVPAIQQQQQFASAVPQPSAMQRAFSSSSQQQIQPQTQQFVQSPMMQGSFASRSQASIPQQQQRFSTVQQPTQQFAQQRDQTTKLSSTITPDLLMKLLSTGASIPTELLNKMLAN
jgi:hypothetical protein